MGLMIGPAVLSTHLHALKTLEQCFSLRYSPCNNGESAAYSISSLFILLCRDILGQAIHEMLTNLLSRNRMILVLHVDTCVDCWVSYLAGFAQSP
jgi:hypothetical protein